MTDSEFLCWIEANRESIRTPLYIYSEAAMGVYFAALKSLFPADVRVFYSLKANPQVGIVRYLSGLGACAEIASSGEHHACSLAGVQYSDILVGGVSKSTEFIDSVCSQGNAGIVVESTTEWQRLQEVVSGGRQGKILLRINPGISLGGLDMAGDSQFGLDVESGLMIANECRANPNIEFLGLHFYFGSQRLAADPVLKMVQTAGDVVETFTRANVPVGVVDLGLGCGVPYLEKDSSLDMADLRSRLRSLWDSPRWSRIRLWTEAGRFLVAGSGFYVARVLERKVRRDKVFIFLDGGLNAHNPGYGVGRFFRSNPKFLVVRGDTDRRVDEFESVDIVGNLCTSADSLGRNVTVPILNEGDLIVIPNSGAYCQTTALWGFNSQSLFLEAILALDGRLTYVEPQYNVLLKTMQK